MDFRIADTFTGSLARLTADEQKLVKTTAFELQMNPENPGHAFHKLDRAKDKNFWSVRVNRDIRIIVHKSTGALLLCYVDHHDKAYDWAERRRVEVHPKTGAAQLVLLRETVQEIIVPLHVYQDATPKRASSRPPPRPASIPARPTSLPPLGHLSDDDLLNYGVPLEWIADVKKASTDTLLTLAEMLPREAGEALLDLATGGTPEVQAVPAGLDPFAHPDAQRRFRTMDTPEELARALEFPWDKWTVFLHPAQREWVERAYSGPARVSGSAGTGKTIVALHRAVHLARKHPDARVLLTTFSDVLANALAIRLRRLLGNEPRLAERLEVLAIDEAAKRIYKSRLGEPFVATQAQVATFIRESAASLAGGKVTQRFLESEWQHVVDAYQLETWEAYRDVQRLGRKTRLSEAKRAELWQVFDAVRQRLAAEGLATNAGVLSKVASSLATATHPVFDFAVVDEAQDLGVAHLRFLAALGKHRKDALFFAGDLGQRIFQQPFSWKSLGVDIRGRARGLYVNYRTSHQIRTGAERLLSTEVSDVDGNLDTRRGTVSAFNGPPPVIVHAKDEADELTRICDWIAARSADGVELHEMALIVRSEAQVPRAQLVLETMDRPFRVLDHRVDAVSGHVQIATMHQAKGLEFRAVCVMACDDEVLPLQARIESIVDEADLDDVYATERHLFYVACTRARDYLLVTGIAPGSEFLGDIEG